MVLEQEQSLPAGWSLESEETIYDRMMGRDYTTVIYREENTGLAVRINEVLEPKANSWGYHVHHSGRNGDLGTVEDLDTAKQTALTFMAESRAS